MAIYGIGATYGATDDVSPQFIKRSLACIGYDEQMAQPLHAILKHFKIDDIVYIKSHPPSVGLIIKVVGIGISDEPKKDPKLGTGIPVKWLWTGQERLGRFDDKYPVRNITLYEEFSPKIQTRVLKLLFSRLQ